MRVKFHDQFYDRDVHLVICTADKFSKKWPNYDIQDACGATVQLEESLMIWMQSLDVNKPKDIATLVHECCHCVFFMALDNDIPLTQKLPEPNSETLAYSVDRLVEGLLTAYSKAKK